MRLNIDMPGDARFAVVLHPGTNEEAVACFFPTFNPAVQLADEHRRSSIAADVMRVLPTGELTTEF